MKKMLTITIAFMMLFTLTSCGFITKKIISTLKGKNETVQEVTEDNSKSNESHSESRTEADEEPEGDFEDEDQNNKKSTDTKKDDVIVTVTDKRNLLKDSSVERYYDRVEMTFHVENLTDKDIKGINGTMTIYDMFGSEIMTMGCDFTGQIIPARDSIDFTDLGINIISSNNSHTKLYNSPLEDLSFDYTVYKIVYTDDDLIKSETISESNEVEISVVNKTSLYKDFDMGRYNSRVEFNFIIKNNTDKNIRGIQGVLKVKDLFGNTIQTIGCDFTQQVIPAGKSIEFSDLGIDINEFDDDDVRILNESFDDLLFTYEVTSIVYK